MDGLTVEEREHTLSEEEKTLFVCSGRLPNWETSLSKKGDADSLH